MYICIMLSFKLKTCIDLSKIRGRSQFAVTHSLVSRQHASNSGDYASLSHATIINELIAAELTTNGAHESDRAGLTMI